MDTMSAYATKLIIDYAASCGISVQNLLQISNVPATILLNDSRWLSYKDWSSLLRAVCKETYRTPYYIGYNIIVGQSYRPTKQIKLMQSLPFSVLKQVLPHIIKSYINKNLNSLLLEDENNIIFNISPIDINLYSKDLCEYNKGVCAAIVDSRLKRFDAEIKETSCIMKGDLCCSYSFGKTFGEVDKVSDSIIITNEDIDYLFREQK